MTRYEKDEKENKIRSGDGEKEHRIGDENQDEMMKRREGTQNTE